MKCVVTGGAGFIGSHLVEELCELGHSVTVIDNLSSGCEANLKSSPLAKLVITEADAFDYADADLVFHLAAVPCVQSSIKDPKNSFQKNLEVSQRVYEACLKSKVGRVVTASSAAVYGDCTEMPLSEQTCLSPQSPYGAAKAAGEMLSSSYARCYDTDFVNLRFFNVYGPRQSTKSPYSGAIGKLCQAAVSGTEFTVFGDGLQTRDFVYVKDVVQGLILAGTFIVRSNGWSFNIGTGRETSLLDLIDAVRLTKDVCVKHGEHKTEPRRSVADISFAMRVLKYEPKWTIPEGIKKTIEWYDLNK